MGQKSTGGQWQGAGVSQTVYSLAYPESRRLIRSTLLEVDRLMERHERPWERRQDGMHEGFKAAWLDFAARAGARLPPDLAGNFYPCSGASEAIRETLALMRSKGAGLVVFEGEYEGFEAVAAGLGMPVARVPRSRWREDLPPLWDKGHELFVSNPSSIDGNYWGAFEACARLAEERGGRVHADLSYLGSCERSVPIELGSESIRSVFFSLSKVFGVYYRRVGGCFSRAPNPLLQANIWFKNLDSLAIGEALLKTFSPGELPRLWSAQRGRALAEISALQGWSLVGADVFMLANGTGEGLESLARAPGFGARVCITPALSKLMEAAHG